MTTTAQVLLVCTAMAAVAATAHGETFIGHEPDRYTLAGMRPEIHGRIVSGDSVDVARVYFRIAAEDAYVFVPMRRTGAPSGEAYRAILPAPEPDAGSIEYLILAKTDEDVVYSSAVYELPVRDSREPVAAPGEPLQVYTELAELPSAVPGFSDSITLDLVESAAKYGVVAGIVNPALAGTTASSVGATGGSLAGSASTAGASAASAGVGTTAATAGIGTGTLVGIGAAAAAGVVGVVAAGDDEPGNRPPAFTGTGTLRLSVNEGATGDIGSARATDPDGDTIRYSLTGSDAPSFSINSSGGISVRSSSELDFESQSTHTFSVVASDGELSTTRGVDVAVSDVNEAPVFPSGDYRVSVPEDVQGMVGEPVLASDPEGDGLTYSLRGADAAEFTIGPDSGQLAIAQGAALDYETRETHRFEVVASDGNLSSSRVVVVEVTDVAELSAAEWQALVALYNATGGDNWTRNDNWDVARTTPPTIAEIRSWYGITVESGRIEWVRLGQNNLTGQIPREVGALRSLGLLSLYGNNLSGPIPRELGSLTELWELGLSGNRLTGSIPDELGNLTNLRFLALHDNDLTGSIPGSLGNLTRLRTQLSLSNNRLTGTVPEELGNLVNLAGRQVREYGGLDLEGNNLYGRLPVALTGLVQLQRLRWRQDGSPSGVADESEYLCAPTDSAFQAWLRGVAERGSHSGGPDCRGNRAPTFEYTSPLQLTVRKGETGIFGTVTATDPDGDDLTYSLSGEHAALFQIGESSGELSVRSSSELEVDRRYAFNVVASDGSLTVSLTVEVTVTAVEGLRDFYVDVELSDKSVDICARDHLTVDGDEIRIIVNDRVVFPILRLGSEERCASDEIGMKVPVELGSNSIEVTALNEGERGWCPDQGIDEGCNTGEVTVKGITSHTERYWIAYDADNPGANSQRAQIIVGDADANSARTDGRLTAVSITSDPGADGVYTAGEALEVELSYSEPVEIGDSSTVWLDIGARRVPATILAPSGPSTTATFRYVVALGDYDPDGVTAVAGTISTRSDATKGTASESVVDFGEHSIWNAAQHVVDTRAQVAEREVLTDTLAATSRAHLNSVGEVVGQRLRGGGMASVAPRAPALAPDGTLGSGVNGGHAMDVAGSSSVGDGPGGSGSWSLAATGPDAPGCSDFHTAMGPARTCLEPPMGWRPGIQQAGRTFPASFALPLGRGEDGGGWTLWGASDVQSFGGQAQAGRYDGDLRSRYVGIDGRVADRGLAGIALSRSVGTTDHGYAVAGNGGPERRGSLRMEMAGAYPYLRVDLADETEAWAIVGFGRGDAKLARPDVATVDESSLELRLGTFGARQGLKDFGSLKLSLTVDAGVVRLRTGQVADPVLSGLRVSVNQVRVGVEGEHQFALADAVVFSPYWRALARRDGGGGPNGRGVELSAGARYASSWLEGHVQGRWLALHTSEHYRERGVSASLRIKPRSGGLGVSASLKHSWGAPQGGTAHDWDRDLFEPSRTDAFGRYDGHSLEGQLGYGVAWPGSAAVVTPFTRATLTRGPWTRQGAGVRIEHNGRRWDRMGAEVAILRIERLAGEADTAIELAGEWRF